MILKTLAIVTGFIGGLAGMTKTFASDKKKSKHPTRKKLDFASLLNKQRIVDSLTAIDILNYFKAATVEGEWLIAKPTEKIATKFGIANLPAQIDPEKNFLLLICNRSGKILTASLISFGEYDEGLKKLLPFGTEDFVVIDKGDV